MNANTAGIGATASVMARYGALVRVAFINPNATQARSDRRKKLAASRSRQAALSASGGVGMTLLSTDGAVDDERETRRQQRILRNRESAAISRKRKSNRIGELEIQVESLQEENRRLRQRIHDSETRADGLSNANLITPSTTRCPSPRNFSNVSATSSATSSALPFSITKCAPTAHSFAADIPSSPSPFSFPGPIAAASCSTTAGGAAAASINNLPRPAVFA
ncbi:unnamed protein product [Ascophyllum nodosum]